MYRYFKYRNLEKLEQVYGDEGDGTLEDKLIIQLRKYGNKTRKYGVFESTTQFRNECGFLIDFDLGYGIYQVIRGKQRVYFRMNFEIEDNILDEILFVISLLFDLNDDQIHVINQTIVVDKWVESYIEQRKIFDKVIEELRQFCSNRSISTSDDDKKYNKYIESFISLNWHNTDQTEYLKTTDFSHRSFIKFMDGKPFSNENKFSFENF